MKLEEYNKVVIKTCQDYIATHKNDNVQPILDFLFTRSPKVHVTSQEASKLIENLPKEITDKLEFAAVYLYYLTKNRYEEIDDETQKLIKNVEASLS
jgi:hypothetical protein